MGILERIGEIEREIGRTQKNKGTAFNVDFLSTEKSILLMFQLILFSTTPSFCVSHRVSFGSSQG